MQKPNIPAESLNLTAGADPAAAVDAIARTARKVKTPCGGGSMVWRVWGAGEPLLLFHGSSGSWTHWIRNIPELSKHYELWVADIPGLGDSAMPPKPWVPASIADVVVAGLDQLFPGHVKLRMAGFSFGGQVAGLSAAMLGDRVCALTLIGVAALGLRADPREPFAKRRPGMSPAEIAAVFHQNLACDVRRSGQHRRTGSPPAGREHQACPLSQPPFAATDNLARALEKVPPQSGRSGARATSLLRPLIEDAARDPRRHHPSWRCVSSRAPAIGWPTRRRASSTPRSSSCSGS
jgi:pimeloyl-ACP methyl ester carboxylesterase